MSTASLKLDLDILSLIIISLSFVHFANILGLVLNPLKPSSYKHPGPDYRSSKVENTKSTQYQLRQLLSLPHRRISCLATKRSHLNSNTCDMMPGTLWFVRKLKKQFHFDISVLAKKTNWFFHQVCHQFNLWNFCSRIPHDLQSQCWH